MLYLVLSAELSCLSLCDTSDPQAGKDRLLPLRTIGEGKKEKGERKRRLNAINNSWQL